jgi:ABC-type lipoprotein export system ATPase subunit
MGTGSVHEVLQKPFHYRANKHLAGNFAQAGELAERFLLAPELLSKDVATLSAGEKQRIAIISAILLGRGILLLDEPTSALDKASRKAVLDYLQSCRDITVLFAAHDEAAFAFAHRIIHLPGGLARRNEQ